MNKKTIAGIEEKLNLKYLRCVNFDNENNIVTLACGDRHGFVSLLFYTYPLEVQREGLSSDKIYNEKYDSLLFHDYFEYDGFIYIKLKDFDYPFNLVKTIEEVEERNRVCKEIAKKALRNSSFKETEEYKETMNKLNQIPEYAYFKEKTDRGFNLRKKLYSDKETYSQESIELRELLLNFEKKTVNKSLKNLLVSEYVQLTRLIDDFNEKSQCLKTENIEDKCYYKVFKKSEVKVKELELLFGIMNGYRNLDEEDRLIIEHYYLRDDKLILGVRTFSEFYNEQGYFGTVRREIKKNIKIDKKTGKEVFHRTSDGVLDNWKYIILNFENSGYYGRIMKEDFMDFYSFKFIK